MKRAVVALLLFLPVLPLWAQDDDGPRPGRDRTDADGMLAYDSEEPVFFDISRYSDEIVQLVLLAIVIAVVRQFVGKRDRNGCTFFIIVFAVLWYLYDRYVY